MNHAVIYTHPGDARRPLTIECSCGLLLTADRNGTARENHEAHWRAETIGKPGVADARAQLEKGRTD